MMRYFSSLLAMYIDLSKKLNNGIEGCEWTRIWKEFRREVIEAGKAIARGRWEALEGTDWHGWTGDGKYSYKDGATGLNFK